ncbi:MAG: uncharacterized protein A8A55_0263 [Amphiamblys sp. WSBS2006]|nr:MAG: uncharacterized protein A8A55_0263 [Amphiamblys sp. WSBS2006]
MGWWKKKSKSKESIYQESVKSSSKTEIEELFKVLVIDPVGNDPTRRKKLESLPHESKIQLVENAQHRQRKDVAVDSVIKRIHIEGVPDIRALEALQQSLKKNPLVWMGEFVEKKGVALLCRAMTKMTEGPCEEDRKKERLLIKMFSTISGEGGYGENIDDSTDRAILGAVCSAAGSVHGSVAADSLEFLSRRVQTGRGGQQTVLSVLLEQQKRKKQPYLFSSVCRKTEKWSEESAAYIGNLLFLFNRIVESQPDVVSRIYYRTEFLRSGFDELLESMARVTDSRVEELLGEYSAEQKKDCDFVERHFDGKLRDIGDGKQVEELFSLFSSEREKHFLKSIFSFLLFLPEGKTIREVCLKLIEKKIFETVFEGKKAEKSCEELTLSDIRVGELLNREHELLRESERKDECLKKKDAEMELLRTELAALKTKIPPKKEGEIETVPIQPEKKGEKQLQPAAHLEKTVQASVSVPAAQPKKSTPPPPPPKMKPPAKKQTGLKKVPWKALPKDRLASSIWKDIKRGEWDEKMLLAKLKEEFSIVAVARTKKREETKQVTFVDDKTARLIEIAFQGNRIDIETFVKDFRELNIEKETLSVTPCLLKVALSSEEEAALQTVGRKMPHTLNFPDRLLCEVTQIKKYKEKIQFVCISSRAAEFVLSTRTPLRAFLASIKRAQYSSHLKVFLSLFLRVGNIMNGTVSQYVSGVDLDVLSTLPAIKGATQSLFDFLVDVFEKTYGDSDLFKEDLEIIAAGINFSLNGASAELARAVEEFSHTAALLASECRDEKKLLAEIHRTEATLSAMEKELAGARTEFRRLLAYFVEETRVESGAFFAMFKTFLSSYLMAKQALCLARTARVAGPTPAENMDRVIAEFEFESQRLSPCL